MRPKAEDETALIRAAQSGDVRAFEALVERYDRQVLELARSLVHNFEDAEDVYQEVFVRVYKHLPRFRFESRFSTWLYRVVVNYCLSYKRRARAAVSLDDPGALNGASRQWTLPSGETTPEAEVLNQELAQRIESALSQLSAQQKAVFVLRHFHGRKLREIAEILACREGTVKNYLFRATQKMQKLLQPYSNA